MIDPVSTALDRARVRAGVDQPLIVLLRAHGGERPEPNADASHRRAVRGDAGQNADHAALSNNTAGIKTAIAAHGGNAKWRPRDPAEQREY
jgi:hypothetical protein